MSISNPVSYSNSVLTNTLLLCLAVDFSTETSRMGREQVVEGLFQINFTAK